MAFGKKDKDETPETLEAVLEPDTAPEDEAPAAGEVTALEPEAPAADPLAGGGDALLSMFQTTEAVGADRAIIIELAGSVELDDLLEELQTVASALGIVASSAEVEVEAEPDFEEQEEYAAA